MALGIRRKREQRDTARKYARQLVEKAMDAVDGVDMADIAHKSGLTADDVQHIYQQVKDERVAAAEVAA